MATTYEGGCHCGRVRFRVVAEKDEAVICNCSICAMKGFVHLIVPKTAFTLLRGDGELSTYTFNTGVAKHTFCKTCGIHAFYTPRSHPDGVDVNVRCLDEATKPELRLSEFDGRNWEAHAQDLAHLSEENA